MNKFTIGVFTCLFILSGCSPETAEPECTFTDYFRSTEPLGNDYMDSIKRSISGDLYFEDFYAELVIAERLENSLDNVLCRDAFPNLSADLANSIHFYQLALEAILQGDTANSEQYMETSHQYFLDYVDDLDVAIEETYK